MTSRRKPFLSLLTSLCVGFAAPSLLSQNASEAKGAKPFDDRFRQLEEILPSPNIYRSASGAPGPRYWQQKVDYEIDIALDDAKQRLKGRETIRYTNKSPDTLRYLWMQLDGNIFQPGSDAQLTRTIENAGEDLSFGEMRALLAAQSFDGSFKIERVTTPGGEALNYRIVKTMMRVDLPVPLAPGQSFRYRVDWNYAINVSRFVRGRAGAEYFAEDDNWLYEVAQWFPRLCAYTDVNGWQHKQFLGRGEFTLEFGDYLVRIDVPEDHVVASTGELQNAADVLAPAWRERLEKARSSDRPMFVITPDEARANQSKAKATGRKTWIFSAKNVRDFAWASSRKFIWDAMGRKVGDRNVLCMSYWPPEGEPLWSRYSTRSVAHTLDIYGRFAFEYPYPVAISVNGPVGGMEYPMICFNGPRPEKDGTYSKRTKYGLISVIIHEVGHNWFPMIVNSDERQWTWMDEGLNTFVQYLAEQEWENGYPSRRGEARQITSYMASANQVPIMTNSESIFQFGNNAYAKPATALNVLRETILGRDLFDFAFREYSRRWRFKRPQPSDLFRSLEDASSIDLDWFWYGWFYTTKHVDIAIRDVREFAIDTQDPSVEKPIARAEQAARPTTRGQMRNAELAKVVEQEPRLADFYNRFDEFDVTAQDRAKYRAFRASLNDEEKAMLANQSRFYVVDFENEGGLVMPVLLNLHYADGTKKHVRIPAEIWRKNAKSVSKLLVSAKPIVRIELDPHEETADIDRSDNHWPRKRGVSRFKLFKRKRGPNPMQKAREAKRASKQESGGRER